MSRSKKNSGATATATAVSENENESSRVASNFSELNYNKTVPIGSQIEIIEEDQISCKCLSNFLGMDATRVDKCYSIFLILFSTIAITCSIFLIKLGFTLNASDMAVIKFLLQVVLCLPFAYFYKENLFGQREVRVLLALKGLVGSLSILAAYFSIRMINFADSMVIRYTSPIVTPLVARIIFKEKLSWIHLISVLLSSVGILLVVRPSVFFFSYGQPKEIENSITFILGIVLALVGSLLAGSTFLFMKKLTIKIHFTIMIFYFSSIGFLVSLAISATIYFLNRSETKWNIYVYRDVSLALFAGLINFIGQICFSLVLAKENANKIGLIRGFDLFLVFILEYFVLLIVPHWITLLGAAFILIGVSVMFIYKIYLLRKKESTYISTNNLFRI
jgi:drug/metabolite transporter (DMT)-like permease